MPVVCTGNITFIIQRRNKTVQINIACVQRRSSAGANPIYASTLQMDGGVFIIDNIAISRSEHCIEGMAVPFQREIGNTVIFYRLPVRYDGDIAARLVMNH
ncbi:hypothetical protein NGUA15_03907 [Salmonella enterica]|nr:hypothetical protein NGUA15_03907 [Salmonella enterica]